MTSFLQLSTIVFVIELLSAQTASPIIVETHLGKIRGTVMKTEKGSDFMGFRGIKYAEAPIGEKRFKSPIAIKKWSGELDATKDGFMCPQVGKPLQMLSEDCLVLNVYTKNTTKSQSVLVYIHGGANVYGGSHSVETAGPEYLMESDDIVFVAISFRLGALGYLSTRTKEAPGNFGYLDQVMALEWIHDHISKFGGNPKSVTIFGMSSGSLACTLHLVSPLSQGLFHKAVVMSGSATVDITFDNLYWTRKLARDCSCPMFNSIDLLNCLRKLPWKTIIAATESWNFYNMSDIKWSYEIDGHFLKKSPTVTFAEGNFSKVPILTGIAKDEFTYMINIHENNSGLLNDMTLNFEKYAPRLFSRNFEDPKIDKAQIVKTFYLGNQPIRKHKLTNFGKIFSDSHFNSGIHRLVELTRKYVNVFYYRFDYLGRFGAYENWKGKPLGVNHADDLQYIIKRKILRERIKYNDPEWFMVERMVTLLQANSYEHRFQIYPKINFGNEFNSDLKSELGSPRIDGINWLPSNKTQVNTMYIGRYVKLGNEPYEKRLQLWDNLYPVERNDSNVNLKSMRIYS